MKHNALVSFVRAAIRNVKQHALVLFTRAAVRNRAGRLVLGVETITAIALDAYDTVIGYHGISTALTMWIVAVWGTVIAFNAGRAEILSNRARTAMKPYGKHANNEKARTALNADE